MHIFTIGERTHAHTHASIDSVPKKARLIGYQLREQRSNKEKRTMSTS